MIHNWWWPVPWQKFMQASFREYFVGVVTVALVTEIFVEFVVEDAALVTGCNVVDVVTFVVIAVDMVAWNVVDEIDDPVTGIFSTVGIWFEIAVVNVVVVLMEDNTYEAVVLTPVEVADFEIVVEVGDFEGPFDVCIFVAEDVSWSVAEIGLNVISSFMNSIMK